MYVLTCTYVSSGDTLTCIYEISMYIYLHTCTLYIHVGCVVVYVKHTYDVCVHSHRNIVCKYSRMCYVRREFLYSSQYIPCTQCGLCLGAPLEPRCNNAQSAIGPYWGRMGCFCPVRKMYIYMSVAICVLTSHTIIHSITAHM